MSAIKEQLHDKIEEGQRGLHKIGWLNMPGYRPETWNPVVGCTKVSLGCENCYAEVMAFRLANIDKISDKYIPVVDFGSKKWNHKTNFIKSELFAFNKSRSPRMVFVCSMSDLFHEHTSFEIINAVFSVMADNSQHIFILLTKRPERMRDFYQWKRSNMMNIPWQPCANVWMGVTAENQEQANKRIPLLLSVPAAKRFVSVEPMLGPVDFYDVVINNEFYNTLKGFGDISGGSYGIVGGAKLDWVICGGESGLKARPMHPDWVRSLREQCKDANVPFFFKGWGTWRPLTTTKLIEKLPFGDYDVETKRGFVKKDKHMIGNCIDGISHEEWPKVER